LGVCRAERDRVKQTLGVQNITEKGYGIMNSVSKPYAIKVEAERALSIDFQYQSQEKERDRFGLRNAGNFTLV